MGKYRLLGRGWRFVVFTVILALSVGSWQNLLAKDIDIYTTQHIRNNAYFMLDNSSSMKAHVYANSVNYAEMYQHLLTLHSPQNYIDEAESPMQLRLPNKVFLLRTTCKVKTWNKANGKKVVYIGDIGRETLLIGYSGTMRTTIKPKNVFDTYTLITDDGSLIDSGSGKQRLTVDDDQNILLDEKTLPFGQDIKLHNRSSLHDKTVVDKGFAGLLRAPGHYFTGYAGYEDYSILMEPDRRDQEERINYFFVTGNWLNMVALSKLKYTTKSTHHTFPAGADSGDQVWKFESYSAPWTEKGYDEGLGCLGGGTLATDTKTVIQPGAKKIGVHFQKLTFSNSLAVEEYLDILDQDGNKIVRYDKDNLPSDGWSDTVSGDTVLLKFYSTGCQAETEYKIDKVRFKYDDTYMLQTRMDIVKDAVNLIIDKLKDKVVFGIASLNGPPEENSDDRFRRNARVRHVVNPGVNRDQNIKKLKEVITDIKAWGSTPLGGTLQDVFEKGYVAQRDKLTDQEGKPYCARNFVIALTDGYPIYSRWDRIKGQKIDDSDGDGWVSTGGKLTFYDDVANYLYKHSWLDYSDVEHPETSNVNVTTHQVSFGLQYGLLADAAVDGGGKYIVAYNKAQLVAAFYSLAIELPKAVAFTTPTSAVNTNNKMEDGDDLYLGLFMRQVEKPWVGNLKKLRFGDGSKERPYKWTIYDGGNNPALGADNKLKDNLKASWAGADDEDANDHDTYGGFDIMEDGAGEVLLEQVTENFNNKVYWSRKIYTSINGVMTRFNRGNISPAMLGVTGDDERDKIINHTYGYTFDVKDANGTPVAVRDWVFGSIIHANVQIVNYYDSKDMSKLEKRYIVVGSNDGMLHVFDDTPGGNDRGKELFAFIPGDLLPKLKTLAAPHLVEMVDGAITLYRRDKQPKYLIFGERRGGNSFWNLDVSDKTPTNWKVKWHYTNPEIEQSWSQMVVASIPVEVDKNTGKPTFKDVVIFSGGYATEEDNFPEPFNDLNSDGTPYSPGTPNINPLEWQKDDPLKDINNNDKYDIFNPDKNEFGRGIFIVDIDNPAAEQKGPLSMKGILPFQLTYGDGDKDISEGAKQTRVDMKFCFPASPTAVLDTVDYRYYDRADKSFKVLSKTKALRTIYATDIYGNVFRVNYDFTVKTDKNNAPEDPSKWQRSAGGSGWSAKKIFSANPGSESASGEWHRGVDANDQGRKVFFPPAISWGGSCKFFDKRNYRATDTTFSGTRDIATLFLGTGDREHPLYKLTRDRLYSIYDDSSMSAIKLTPSNPEKDIKVSTVGYTENNLLNLTCNELGKNSKLAKKPKTEVAEQNKLRDLLVDDATYTNNKGIELENGLKENDAKGWYIVLEDQTKCSLGKGSLDNSTVDSRDNHEGEKITSPITLSGGVVYFTTYQPRLGDMCTTNSGNGFIYALRYCDGTSVYDLDKSGKDGLTNRYMKYIGVGIPPAVSIVFRGGEVKAINSMGGELQLLDANRQKDNGERDYFYWREGNSSLTLPNQ